jgi:hypothetical protein
VRAPAAGRVSTLQAAAGRLADPRQPQLAILPSNSALQAELFLPTRADVPFSSTTTAHRNAGGSRSSRREPGACPQP